MRLTITVQATVDIDPEWYPEHLRSNPVAMVELDLGNDAGGFLSEAEDFKVVSVEVT